MIKYEKKKKAFQEIYDKLLNHLRSLDENLFGPDPIKNDDIRRCCCHTVILRGRLPAPISLIKLNLKGV